MNAESFRRHSKSWWSLSEANRQLVRKFYKEEAENTNGDLWESEHDTDRGRDGSKRFGALLGYDDEDGEE